MDQIIKEKKYNKAKKFILKYHDSRYLDEKTKEEFGNLNTNLNLENANETYDTIVLLYKNCEREDYKREREEEEQGNIALMKAFVFGAFLIFIAQYINSFHLALFGSFICFSIIIGSFAKALG